MSPVILTLQVPKGSRGIPVATTADAHLLCQFRRVVLSEAHRRVELAEDDVEALLARLELERLERALAMLIPDDQPHLQVNGREGQYFMSGGDFIAK